MKRIRPNVKLDLDVAVARAVAPEAPRGGGLGIPVAGRRRIPLVTRDGHLTGAGEYYYQKTGAVPPTHGFNKSQTPVKRGQREMIQLLDGTTRAVSMWRGGEWKPTNLGKKFFEGAVVRYTVSFPVFVDLTRANGSVYRREDWLARTAVPRLGEIETKRGASEQEQIQDVRRKTRAFLDGLPEGEG